MTEELRALFEKVKDVEMTPEREAEQRRSFVYGNTHIENSRITRAMVDEADEKIALERSK